jgi:hypothetical protein
MQIPIREISRFVVLLAADQSCFAIGTEGCVLRLSVGPEPALLPMLVSTVGTVSVDMCMDSNRIVYSTEDMVLSALSFDLDGGESLAVSGEVLHALPLFFVKAGLGEVRRHDLICGVFLRSDRFPMFAISG